MPSEDADVVVIGARLGGCAVAAPLARSGRRVVVLDRMAFPSDQLSTHVLFCTGTSELAQIGALERIRAHDPCEVRYVHAAAGDVTCLERLRPAADGTDHGVCVPRDLQDACLVEAVRDQGGDVRERSAFTAVVWRGGRVAGVRYVDAGGDEREIAAKLVVGADGRRSSVAAAVGAWAPYRVSRNGRGLVFRYLDDPRPGDSLEAQCYYQWRDGESIAFAFPSAPRGRMLVLFMGHRDEVGAARRDGEAYWARKLAEHPGLRERVAGADPASFSKLRSTADTPAFFRASSGPGWALVGDAGHFKDPVTGQGMRDAMWTGRTLAEAVLGVLDDPLATDRATRRWEAARDAECLPAYHFANLDTRVETPSPVIRELLRDAGRTREPDVGDLFGRARTLQEIAPLPRLARATAAALLRGETPRLETFRRTLADGRMDAAIRRETRARRFRSTRVIAGSDHPGTVWPAPPAAARTAREAVPA